MKNLSQDIIALVKAGVWALYHLKDSNMCILHVPQSTDCCSGILIPEEVLLLDSDGNIVNESYGDLKDLNISSVYDLKDINE